MLLPNFQSLQTIQLLGYPHDYGNLQMSWHCNMCGNLAPVHRWSNLLFIGFQHVSTILLVVQDFATIHTSQWEFQDPKMEVLYHIKPYFAGIFPYMGLKNRPYIWNRYLQFRILNFPLNYWDPIYTLW